MGAWPYVKPRLDTAMRELFGHEVAHCQFAPCALLSPQSLACAQ